MNRITLLVLAAAIFCMASNFNYFLGLRSSKYAIAGIEGKHFGFVGENSLFIEDDHLQYARGILFYTFVFPLNFKGYYAVYGGSRYNHDYYDYGAGIQLEWNPITRLFQVGVLFQPFYDSDLKTKYGYKTWIQSVFFDDIGLFGGIKNLPDFRNTEERFFGGVIFDLDKLKLCPEISRPTDGSFYTTRITINFIYKNSI